MAEAVPVRCPTCRRENTYSAPVFPCACGSPVTPPLNLAAPTAPLTRRSWSDSWVAVRCEACGRESEWPRPEVGCAACGTVALIPVHPPGSGDPAPPAPGPVPEARGMWGMRGPRGDIRSEEPGAASGAGWSSFGADSAPGSAVPADPPAAGPPVAEPPAADPPAAEPPAADRAPFRPVTIRTGRDAVVTAALYLRWLGFRDVRRPDGPPTPAAAVDLRAPGVVAQVDPTTAPAGLRAVECVWLNGLTVSAASVYFSLAGYTTEARERADHLGIPLFVMDLTGMPQPVNDPADRLIASGA
ncbi:hypothetical protein ACIRO3_12590 [Streptomyces sp. NPDC102278]|uniref:hypothetical protein n=1 Tax=Streptomyces sp. NPDC102278 TaxID=3366152 RepID=UPI0037F26B08